MELIHQAAIQTPDKKVWTLPRPSRHHDIISLIYEMVNDGMMVIGIQGFITNTERFVGREEALTIALFADQLIAKHPQAYELYSEDVW